MKETICTVVGLVGGFIATLLGGSAPGASLQPHGEEV